jgi:catechol 2,3-dioxygenase-like lactoylglutathione lyase family enzyme
MSAALRYCRLGGVVLALTLALSLALQPSAAGPGTSAAGPLVTGVESVGLSVSDMDRSVDFYSQVLSFEKVSDQELAGEEQERLRGVFAARVRVVRMRLGDETVELTEFLAPRGRPAPVDSRSNDGWFQHVAIIVSDMDRAYRVLRKHRVTHISPGPQRLPDWNPNAGGIRAFYFRDPDGHPLEILQFPPDKGDPKWRRRTDRLFLGIDHTAIAVADTEKSLRFYRDGLGIAVAGESENYGPEQERLNGVFGARLRITALRAATGPGIEFLEYLAPRDGRPMPADEKASDLVHWETNLTAPGIGAGWKRLQALGVPFISPGPVQLCSGARALTALSVRDPDGHALVLAEAARAGRAR